MSNIPDLSLQNVENKSVVSVALSHTNNYDFLRLLFSTFVLISHSYALLGLPEADIYYQWSHGQTSLSTTAVYGFFVLSGLLITKSLIRSSSLIEYFYKRTLRIFPGFWIVLSAVAIIGFLISGKDAGAYFFQPSTRDYVIFSAVFRLQYFIDGVFTHNPMTQLNGSLWTIPYEFACYIILALTFFFRKQVQILRPLFVVVFLVLFAFLFTHFDIKHVPESTVLGLKPMLLAQWGIFFAAGAVWAVIPLPSERMRNIIGWLSLLLLLAGLHFQDTSWLEYLLLSPVLVCLGSLRYPVISSLRKIGDVSYGTYLWGWPIQQTIIYFMHPTYLQLVLTCIPLAWIMGYISWKIVEEPSLSLKIR